MVTGRKSLQGSERDVNCWPSLPLTLQCHEAWAPQGALFVPLDRPAVLKVEYIEVPKQNSRTAQPGAYPEDPVIWALCC